MSKNSVVWRYDTDDAMSKNKTFNSFRLSLDRGEKHTKLTSWPVLLRQEHVAVLNI